MSTSGGWDWSRPWRGLFTGRLTISFFRIVKKTHWYIWLTRSARLCFAEVLKTEGKISDAEYAILDYWYKFLTNKEAKYPTGFDTEADIIIYLQTTPEVANQRINGR